MRRHHHEKPIFLAPVSAAINLSFSASEGHGLGDAYGNSLARFFLISLGLRFCTMFSRRRR
ncbi:hypothetical protein BJV78DRAFT_1209345 [Lactifluus subvellereus]|nr:hypothetical protein BJV78DRAFT_1209345 [Lactifluus subvellereus]